MREGRGAGEGVSELLVRVGQGLGCQGDMGFYGVWRGALEKSDRGAPWPTVSSKRPPSLLYLESGGGAGGWVQRTEAGAVTWCPRSSGRGQGCEQDCPRGCAFWDFLTVATTLDVRGRVRWRFTEQLEDKGANWPTWGQVSAAREASGVCLWNAALGGPWGLRRALCRWLLPASSSPFHPSSEFGDRASQVPGCWALPALGSFNTRNNCADQLS